MTEIAIKARGQSLSFSGHDSFALRHGWLEKAYLEVENSADLNNPFLADDSIVRFGVGKNMVNAIKHWALAANFVNRRGERFEASEYAKAIMSFADPYLEKTTTMWKIHYEIAKNPLNTTIYWIFSHLNSASFSKENLERRLQDYCVQNGVVPPASKTLKTDIGVSLAMYCNGNRKMRVSEDDISCPLQELNLIKLNHDGTYSISSAPKKSLSSNLLVTTICDYWEKTDPNSSSIKLDSLLYTPGSPGRIFALTETELLDHVSTISRISSGMLEISETAGITQIFKNQNTFDLATIRNLWLQT